jgi:hypothetical protein
MTQLVGPTGISGYEWQGTDSLSKEAYTRIRNWTVLWSDIEIAKADVPHTRKADRPWRKRSNWRRLQEGMTMSEVRAILGQPTNVESTGFVYWVYGGQSWLRSPHVSFFLGK